MLFLAIIITSLVAPHLPKGPSDSGIKIVYDLSAPLSGRVETLAFVPPAHHVPIPRFASVDIFPTDPFSPQLPLPRFPLSRRTAPTPITPRRPATTPPRRHARPPVPVQSRALNEMRAALREEGMLHPPSEILLMLRANPFDTRDSSARLRNRKGLLRFSSVPPTRCTSPVPSFEPPCRRINPATIAPPTTLFPRELIC